MFFLLVISLLTPIFSLLPRTTATHENKSPPNEKKLELLKNSMRATVEYHGIDADYPPIKVVIADGSDNEDVIIKVSDEGGGIPRSNMKRIWSYVSFPVPYLGRRVAWQEPQMRCRTYDCFSFFFFAFLRPRLPTISYSRLRIRKYKRVWSPSTRTLTTASIPRWPVWDMDCRSVGAMRGTSGAISRS